MPALTNDPARCEVLNLGYGPGGHGPWLVRQEGYPPDSVTLRPDYYILQRDGSWMINLAFGMLPESAQEQQLFHSMTEVGRFLGELANRPLICHSELPKGHDAADILAHFEQCTHHILKGMRRGIVVRDFRG